MSRHVHPHAHRRSTPWILAGVAAVVLIALLVGLRFATSSEPHFVNLAPIDHHAVTGQRTVVIAQAGAAMAISGTDGQLMTTLVEGQVPAGATHAVVRTDTECEADAQGVSHCHNLLDIDGTLVEVQHHHKMSTTPCLTPGETVAVTEA